MSTNQPPQLNHRAVPGAASNAITISPRARRLIRLLARGRRSGRAYATPLGMRPLGDSFVMPRTFGQHSAWYHNLRAAGGAVVTWGGTDHSLYRPQLVDAATAMPAFPRYERRLLGLLGIDEFVLLHRAPAGWHPSPTATASTLGR